MVLSNKLNEDLVEVDIIVAGGGTAACTVAARLADADPDLSILVIESGPDNYMVPNIINPAFFLQHLAPGSKTANFYMARKSDYLAGRQSVVATGGVLGGGSSINFLVYTRPQRSDYDSWNVPGWSTDEMLSYMKKFEDYHGRGDSKTHGSGGPVQITNGPYRAESAAEDFFQAAAKVGYPQVEDLQNFDTNNAFERWLRYISHDGKRQDAAHLFIHPRLRDGEHPNLHVLVESKVVKVLFDNEKRACGVEYLPQGEPDALHGNWGGEIRTVRAKKLVILSCGTLGTPQILERSGIGNPEVLERAGVPVVENLPGVGENYQDHHLMLYSYKTALGPDETLDELWSGRVSTEDAMAQGHKLMGWNSADICGKIRPTESEVDTLGPEFRRIWDRDFRENANRPIMLVGTLNGYTGDRSATPEMEGGGQFMTISAISTYPYSRGSVHITGREVGDPLDFDAGIYSDPNSVDIKSHIWAYKKQREILRRTKYYRGEVTHTHPKFPAGSKAACIDGAAMMNPDGQVDNIEYTADDDQAIEQHLRELTNSTWHSLGTAKMGARESGGVVDADLNVYGVKGLKVIDLSICPENVAANTTATAFMIGEKGADLVLNYLRLRED